MRKSFIDRLQSENEARSANSELITAISHDLRTPLTALVGYLDIIEYKKLKSFFVYENIFYRLLLVSII